MKNQKKPVLFIRLNFKKQRQLLRNIDRQQFNNKSEKKQVKSYDKYLSHKSESGESSLNCSEVDNIEKLSITAEQKDIQEFIDEENGFSESESSNKEISLISKQQNNFHMNKKFISPMEKTHKKDVHKATPYSYSLKTELINWEKEVDKLTNKERKSKDKRKNYKNFIPKSREEFEQETVGPDKLSNQDPFFNQRYTKSYTEFIEKEKVEKFIGVEQTKIISKPLVAIIKRKYRSKSQERKKKRVKKTKKYQNNKIKRNRKGSMNIILMNTDGDLRKHVYKNKALNF